MSVNHDVSKVKNPQCGWSELTPQKSVLGLLMPQKWLQTHQNDAAGLSEHDYDVSDVFGCVWMATGAKNMNFAISPPGPQEPYGPLTFHALAT